MLNRITRATALLLALLLLMATIPPIPARAQSRIIRVGWFESPFNATDALGRRSGYAYDYQQKIAAYTGWTYEYVEGSWSDLLQMLSEGRIDLLSDVSYTPERAERMLYSALPMGAEEYYLYISPRNTEIQPQEYATFNGKRVGANKGSVQIDLLREWCEANGVEIELVELTSSEEDNITRLTRGDIDMYLSLDGFFNKSAAVPVCKIGASDFFFAVSKSRPELMLELNSAMSRIQDESPLYRQQLYSKYLKVSGLNYFLSAEEIEWLDDHGSIRVGYQDNYLAFCARDPNTGTLTGALSDYLNVAADCLKNAHLDFEPVCFPSSAAAMAALKAGEVDCVFPANLTDYDGEQRGVFLTPALMRTDMSAVIRESDLNTFSRKERVTVAVNTDNPNYDMFLLDHFPTWRSIYFLDTPECLKAVAEGQADCVLISNFRYNNIAQLCEKYRLTAISTGVEINYCFAVDRKDTLLYSILARTTGIVPTSTVNAALTYYFTEDSKTHYINLLRQNQHIVILMFIALALASILLLALNIWRARRADIARPTVPIEADFRLLDDLPLSYSVYHVTHAEHSALYDARIVYVNHKFEALGGLPARAVLGHSVRELFPHVGEGWYLSVKSAACDGTPVDRDYEDEFSGKHYRFIARQLSQPDYCAVIYMET